MAERTIRARATGVALLLLVCAPALGAPLLAQRWRVATFARQRQGERTLSVSLDYGAGRLRVAPGPAEYLYQFETRYDEERAQPETSYDRDAGALRLAVRGRGGKYDSDRREGGYATLALNPAVATALRLQFGAGEADLDLGGLVLRRVDLSTGASQTRVRFTQPNRAAAERVRIAAGVSQLEVMGLGNARAQRIEFDGGVGSTILDFSGGWTTDAIITAKLGVGSLRLRLPRSVGVRVVKDSFLTSFDASGMVKRGGAWYSRNWGTAPRKLTIEIDAGLGSINVDWID